MAQKTFPTLRGTTVRDAINQADMIFFGRIHALGNHSPKQWAFKQKLFAITRERKTKEVNECDDIDATAYLTVEEFENLVAEAKNI